MRQIRFWRPELCAKSSAHDLIKHQLELPDYYGKNLDALWDMLIDISQPIRVVFDGPANDYSQQIEDLFIEAAAQNINISIHSNELTLVRGADILNYQHQMSHRLYRRMLMSDYGISLWSHGELKGWLIAQQSTEALIIEACRAEEADYLIPLLDQLMIDWPDERLVFLDDAPGEIAGYQSRQLNVSVFERQKNRYA